MTYYVATNGFDGGAGTLIDPWLTPSKAFAVVTTPGDIIHINAGVYTITAQLELAVGVSVEGAGVTSIIHSHVTGAPTIALFSGSTGISGNQSISYINMNGDNLTAHSAIEVSWRSNVEIHHCTFENFSVRGVIFGGNQNSWPESIPSSSEYSSGNSFHHNIMNNCAEYVASNDNGWGNVCVGLQVGMKVYNNSITQNQRAAADNGYCIKFYNYGWNKGLQIYNNTLINKPPEGPQPNMSWGFAIESWNSLGGLEIYGNTIKGCIDLVKVYKGTYSKGVDIHDNILGYDSPTTDMDTEGEVGIRLEDMVEYAYIYNNYFKHHAAAIYCSRFGNYDPAKYFDNINIYSNVMYNIGSNYSEKGWGLRFTVDNHLSYFTNFNIWNNVIIARASGSTVYGLMVPPGVNSNVSIRNNIIQDFDSAPIYGEIEVTGLSIENNIFYGNGNSNVPIYTGSATVQNNLTTQPPFTSSSDFHLTEDRTGIDVGLTSDYDGNTWSNPPSIGAYQFGSAGQVSPPVEIFVESITLEGEGSVTTIETDNGILLIIPSILPVDADDTSVTWSVIGGTGTGSITSNGYLTAITDGTVTVRATAQDGSGVYGELEITISNQVATRKNIAPIGWHVPTRTELMAIQTFLGGEEVAGGKLKETGNAHWEVPNEGATNETGFTGLPSGWRDGSGNFGGWNKFAYYWTCTEFNATTAWYGNLDYLSAYFSIGHGHYKTQGNPIFCIKDDSINPGFVTDIDGNVYPTCKIDTLVCMAANLKVTRFNDGTPIPEVTDNTDWINLTTAGRCWYNNTP